MAGGTARIVLVLGLIGLILLVQVVIPGLFVRSGLPGWSSVAYAAEEAADLQRIVDAARPGETVEVPPGVYAGPLVVRKPVVLAASPSRTATIVHEGDGPAVRIESPGAALRGFRIDDVRMKEEPTVLVVSADGAMLEDLDIRTGSIGIAVRDSAGVTVRGSRVEWGAPQARPAAKGNGIDLFRSHRALVADNAVSGMHDAIYVEMSDDARIENNTVERSRYGIHTMYSDRPEILGNAGALNVTGAMVMTGRGAIVAGNRFARQNENVRSQGILLFDAHEAVLRDNEVEGNRVGLYVEQSMGGDIERNRIRSNFIGIQLIDARDNRFRHNHLSGNVADAQAIRSADNEFRGNYWDSFRGIDADGDGLSDLGYAINPFFLGFADRRPAFQLLFQSPGMEFLEGLFQADRDNWTMDTAPLMEPKGSDGGNGSDGTDGADGAHDAGHAGGSRTGAHPTGLAGVALMAAASFLMIRLGRKRPDRRA